MHHPDYSRPRIKVPNYWYSFLIKNKNLIRKKSLLDKVENFDVNVLAPFHLDKPYDINFKLDGWSSDLHWELIEKIKDKKYSLLDQFSKEELQTRNVFFFNNNEGYCTDEIFNTIHWIIEAHGMPPKNVTYQNLAVNIQEMYDLYCVRNKISADKKINVVTHNIYNNSKLLIYIQPLRPGTIFDVEYKKMFMCLNWTSRPHRHLTVAWLMYRNLIQYGNVTTPSDNLFEYNSKVDFDTFKHNIKAHLDKGSILKDDELEIFKTRINDFQELYPLMIDDRRKYKSVDESFYTDDPNDTIADRIYRAEIKAEITTARLNSLIEIVTETYTDGTIQFSEKTFWPIVTGIPFIHIHSKHSLKKLKELGYRTYNPYINESYDNEDDLETRIQMVTGEIERLNEMRRNDPGKFYMYYTDMLAIARFNKSVFLKTNYIENMDNFIKS